VKPGLRVIAGSLKGRRLETPAWEGLRPTSDKLRETLFNVIAGRVAGARVLDGYAGSGAIGIEAVSRGAAHVTFIEQDPRAQALIAANLARCGVQSGYAIIRGTVASALASLRATPFDVIVLDPPYSVPADAALTAIDGIAAPDGLVVLEHARRQRTPEQAGRLIRTRELISGDSALSFYSCQP
jgi:16S rRNA (guanine966-N2)-methyltransferase